MNIIIVSHGQFGQGLLNAYEMLKGKNHFVKTVSFDGKDSADFEKNLALLINPYLENFEETLILSDIDTGIPHEKAKIFSKLSPHLIEHVSGVCLPMLVEACELMDSVLSVSDLAMFIQASK